MGNPERQLHLWHSFPIPEVQRVLGVNAKDGLTAMEVRRRQATYGANQIDVVGPRSGLRILIAQFQDFLIALLAAAAVVAGFVGDIKDAAAIAAIIILNGIVGFIQEYRSERAVHALRNLSAPLAKVRRDNVLQIVPASSLVLGDIVILEAGDIVPADLRLFETCTLRTQEALLTGESAPVDKATNPITASSVPVAERSNMVFKGSAVVSGRGSGIVAATGMDTEIGRIAALIATVDEPRTPLQQRLAQFGRVIAVAVLAISAIVFVAGVLRGEPPILIFLTAVSLAVAAVPEALPAVITVALAIGARTMARSNALVRHLAAIEALGSVDVIFSDKTGTLTENRMNAARFAVGASLASTSSVDDPRWILFWMGLALVNDVVADTAGRWTGDPTEIALVEAAEKAGVQHSDAATQHPRIGEIPFSSERRCMTTVHQWNQPGMPVRAFMKGAPEEIIQRCTSAADGILDTRFLGRCADRWASEGLRVIAVATRTFASEPELSAVSIEREFTFLGFAGLIDPPRPETKMAVLTCRTAGITPIMITGDHPATARAVAVSIGLAAPDGSVVTGQQLEAMTEPALKEALQTTHVFARIAPEQKIRLVRAMQQIGHAVAMTGDGVNDAPALKQADVGVAMGKMGTEVAREAADLVLLDDNFATIVTAVREGRRISDNIRKFVRFVLAGNLGEILTVLLAPFLGLPLPLLPIQILWVNLVTDGLPSLALATERAEPDVMIRPPRSRTESILAGGMPRHIFMVGFAIAAACLIVQAAALSMKSPRWQTMVFSTLTLGQLAYAASVRTSSYVTRSRPRPTGATLIAVGATTLLQMAAVYLPPLNEFLHTEPLTVGELTITSGAAASIFLVAEFSKFSGVHSNSNRA